MLCKSVGKEKGGSSLPEPLGSALECKTASDSIENGPTTSKSSSKEKATIYLLGNTNIKGLKREEESKSDTTMPDKHTTNLKTLHRHGIFFFEQLTKLQQQILNQKPHILEKKIELLEAHELPLSLAALRPNIKTLEANICMLETNGIYITSTEVLRSNPKNLSSNIKTLIMHGIDLSKFAGLTSLGIPPEKFKKILQTKKIKHASTASVTLNCPEVHMVAHQKDEELTQTENLPLIDNFDRNEKDEKRKDKSDWFAKNVDMLRNHGVSLEGKYTARQQKMLLRDPCVLEKKIELLEARLEANELPPSMETLITNIETLEANINTFKKNKIPITSISALRANPEYVSANVNTLMAYRKNPSEFAAAYLLILPPKEFKKALSSEIRKKHVVNNNYKKNVKSLEEHKITYTIPPEGWVQRLLASKDLESKIKLLEDQQLPVFISDLLPSLKTLQTNINTLKTNKIPIILIKVLHSNPKNVSSNVATLVAQEKNHSEFTKMTRLLGLSPEKFKEELQAEPDRNIKKESKIPERTYYFSNEKEFDEFVTNKLSDDEQAAFLEIGEVLGHYGKISRKMMNEILNKHTEYERIFSKVYLNYRVQQIIHRLKKGGALERVKSTTEKEMGA